MTAKGTVWLRMTPFLGMAFVGGLLFFLLGTQLDSRVEFKTHVFGPQFFMFCFTVFLNIRHYFIDFAIWRRDNPEMQHLFH